MEKEMKSMGLGLYPCPSRGGYKVLVFYLVLIQREVQGSSFLASFAI